MRYLSIEKLQSGMICASTIQDVYGRVLVERNKPLTDTYIDHLKSLGFAGIYVDDEASAGIEIEPSISNEVRRQAMGSVKSADPDLCAKVSVSIVEELFEKKRVSMDLMDIRSNSDFTYAHSVNVAVISGIIALGMRLGREKMKEVITVGLLHDLGKLQIPDEILNKPERLSSEEYKVMKSHALLSYDYVAHRTDISDDVKLAIRHHHENVDGSGYPDGLTGDQQNIYTKIVHVADVYDALTSKRPYKEPFAPYEALEYLMGGCGTYFDQSVVEALSIYVPLYPKGTELSLSDGQRGLVFDNTGIHNMRPVVKLLSGRRIDLTHREYINVAIVMDNIDHSANILENEKKRKTMADRQMIYVIEENKSYLSQLKEELKENYEIHEFERAESAITKLRRIRKKPKLIIMNTELETISGIELAKQIREITKNEVPILFVSEKADTQTIIQVRSLGAEGYVLRPYQSQYLLKEMERILKSMVR